MHAIVRRRSQSFKASGEFDFAHVCSTQVGGAAGCWAGSRVAMEWSRPWVPSDDWWQEGGVLLRRLRPRGGKQGPSLPPR